MGDNTKIEWADHTLNLWFGCTQISPACDHCYAMKIAPRLGVTWNAPPRVAADSAFAKIANYERGAMRFMERHGHAPRVFVNSLSDFFDNQAMPEWRDRACRGFELAPNVMWLLVTKRPQNVPKMVPAHWLKPDGWPPNVWLGVTAENQEQWDIRVAHLLAIPGVDVRFVSMEPMLEIIHPGRALSFANFERANFVHRYAKKIVPDDQVGSLRWVIIGGESGGNARPMPPSDQVATLSTSFQASGVAVFVKQMSQADSKTFKDIATFPRGLKTRNHPQ